MTIIYFITALAGFLIWNYYVIVKLNRSPNHAMQQILRSVVWIIGATLFGHGLITESFTYLIGFHLAFWFPFDTGLNLLRGRAWNYKGQTAMIDTITGYDLTPLKILFFIMGMGLLYFGYLG